MADQPRGGGGNSGGGNSYIRLQANQAPTFTDGVTTSRSVAEIDRGESQHWDPGLGY